MQRRGRTRKWPIARHISAPVPLSFLKWRIIYGGTCIIRPFIKLRKTPNVLAHTTLSVFVTCTLKAAEATLQSAKFVFHRYLYQKQQALFARL